MYHGLQRSYLGRIFHLRLLPNPAIFAVLEWVAAEEGPSYSDGVH